MTATDFTPVASLLGGALIGASAVMLMAAQGRIAGVSGIAVRLLPPYADSEFAGRLAFTRGRPGDLSLSCKTPAEAEAPYYAAQEAAPLVG